MKFEKIKEILLFFLLLFLFLVVIFLLKNFVFVWDKNTFVEEEHFVEPKKLEISKNEEKVNIQKKKEYISENDSDFKKILQELEKIEDEENRKKINYSYFPENIAWKSKTLVYKKFFDTFFLSKTINQKIKNLDIFLYKEPFEVRWRLKDRKIHIFWLYYLPFKEALAVSIHEFWHFIDLYILKKNVFKDLSYDFYDISWSETNILKSNSKLEDFVSGYAMTNCYEDFAETFAFYILHNEEFQLRMKQSLKLQEKYNFMKKYIFPKGEFITNEFSAKIEQKNIWDTTKLDFDFDKFRKYLQKIEN